MRQKLGLLMLDIDIIDVIGSLSDELPDCTRDVHIWLILVVLLWMSLMLSLGEFNCSFKRNNNPALPRKWVSKILFRNQIE